MYGYMVLGGGGGMDVWRIEVSLSIQPHSVSCEGFAPSHTGCGPELVYEVCACAKGNGHVEPKYGYMGACGTTVWIHGCMWNHSMDTWVHVEPQYGYMGACGTTVWIHGCMWNHSMDTWVHVEPQYGYMGACGTTVWIHGCMWNHSMDTWVHAVMDMWLVRVTLYVLSSPH